ncbi:epidermin leader peptide processing serine protease EpiP [Staphylococcus xylosus]|uniref:S8 family serine peptidase n=1 Tax=Staphylococcus xylosus TaxID=1288 RepID=UPI00085C3DC6|nr:S8 family serine peptidase [Staphylococcus xylosus]SCU36942.1 epidermin leader peptide processing serine protease EpiP [Staphylococcus xylosus]
MLEICNWPNKDNIFSNFNYNIKILYIDSGCDIYHDELRGNILINESISFVEGDKSLKDYTGHGTQMVSAIVGKNKVNGLYKKCKIVMYKITNSQGITKFEWLYKALSQAIKMNYKIINISYAGISTSQKLNKKFQRLIDEATEANIHICCSADNNQNDKDTFIIPASLKNVYTIGSLNFQNKISTFNKQSEVNYYAPGGDDVFRTNKIESFILLANSITSDFNIGAEMGLDKKYTLNFGNSIACSYFSCCIALILAMVNERFHIHISKKKLDELYKKSENINTLLNTKEILLNGVI